MGNASGPDELSPILLDPCAFARVTYKEIHSSLGKLHARRRHSTSAGPCPLPALQPSAFSMSFGPGAGHDASCQTACLVVPRGGVRLDAALATLQAMLDCGDAYRIQGYLAFLPTNLEPELGEGSRRGEGPLTSGSAFPPLFARAWALPMVVVEGMYRGILKVHAVEAVEVAGATAHATEVSETPWQETAVAAAAADRGACKVFVCGHGLDERALRSQLARSIASGFEGPVCDLEKLEQPFVIQALDRIDEYVRQSIQDGLGGLVAGSSGAPRSSGAAAERRAAEVFAERFAAALEAGTPQEAPHLALSAAARVPPSRSRSVVQAAEVTLDRNIVSVAFQEKSPLSPGPLGQSLRLCVSGAPPQPHEALEVLMVGSEVGHIANTQCISIEFHHKFQEAPIGGVNACWNTCYNMGRRCGAVDRALELDALLHPVAPLLERAAPNAQEHGEIELHRSCDARTLMCMKLLVDRACSQQSQEGQPIDIEASAEHLLGSAAEVAGLTRDGCRGLDPKLPTKALAAAVRAAGLVASIPAASGRLLEEPWLSFLSSALLRVQSQVRFGEVCSRRLARLRTELQQPEIVTSLLRHVRGSQQHQQQNQQHQRQQQQQQQQQAYLTACPRRGRGGQDFLGQFSSELLGLLADDLTACSLLIRSGALPVVFDALQSDSSGLVYPQLRPTLAKLSASPDFAPALRMLPPARACTLLDLAAEEVKMLGRESVAGCESASALQALLNVCKASCEPPLPQRLAERGAIGLLVAVVTDQGLEFQLRLEAAEALCRLPAPDNDEPEAAVPSAALYCVAAPATVAALISLCSGSSLRAGRSSSRASCAAVQGARQALRYRLPWLLACAARGAAAADLAAWAEESIGVRSLLVDSVQPCRARDVNMWSLDVIAALCGRLAPRVLLEFLGRGQQPLLASFPRLLAAGKKAISQRAAVVGYYIAAHLPPSSAAREELLDAMPVRALASITLPWRQTPLRCSSHQQQLGHCGSWQKLQQPQLEPWPRRPWVT
ncbi:unnamed protein product [Polarella glacialis]|uniref:Uncharacterized protein n=1 Tax=Polarella glacialis TaxID=89957 RepID=A0A813DSC1_POLGL|nr:unnamed protein product [Polarella glacialis]